MALSDDIQNLTVATQALAQIAQEQITPARDQAVSAAASATASAALAAGLVEVKRVSESAYTLLASDWNKQLVFTSDSSVTVTANASSVMGVSEGSTIALTQQGAGAVSLVGSGVTVRNAFPTARYYARSYQFINNEVWSF